MSIDDDGFHVFFEPPSIEGVFAELSQHLPQGWKIVPGEPKSSEDDDDDTSVVPMSLQLPWNNEGIVQKVQTAMDELYGKNVVDITGWTTAPSFFISNGEDDDNDDDNDGSEDDDSESEAKHKTIFNTFRDGLGEVCAKNGWVYDVFHKSGGVSVMFYDKKPYDDWKYLERFLPDAYTLCMGVYLTDYTLTVRNKLQVRITDESGSNVVYSQTFSLGSGKHDVHVYEYPDTLFVVTPETMGGTFVTACETYKSTVPIPNRFRRQILCNGEVVVDVAGRHDFRKPRYDVHLTDEGDCAFWSFAREYIMGFTAVPHPSDLAKIVKFLSEAKEANFANEVNEAFSIPDPISHYGLKNIMVCGGVLDDSITGIAIRQWDEDIKAWCIKTVFVTPSMRLRGIGRDLVKELVTCKPAIVKDPTPEAKLFFEAIGFSSRTVNGVEVLGKNFD